MFALAVPNWVFAGDLTLHPAGFGQHSYAAWKAQQGQPDSTGNANQALYFQKMTTTATNAAGVAVIQGISGLPANDLTGLAWDHREDGHCGAGAPRWDIFVRDSAGNNYTVFLGCNAAAHSEKGVINGFGWCRDTQPSPSGAISAQTGVPVEDLNTLTITGLAIVFDEGSDTPNPPPAGCGQQSFVGGFVYLDNIEVATTVGTKCWMSASDNSNNSTGPCADPPSPSADLSPIVLSPLSGLPVDPTDIDLVTALEIAAPQVALTEWSLYPYIYQ